MRVLGQFGEHETMFRALTRQAQRGSVSAFLLRDDDELSFGGLNDKKMIPYDFGSEAPGPTVRDGDLSFPCTVCVPLAIEDLLAFCIMAYSDGTEIRQDKSVLWFDTELQTFNGVNIKSMDDGTKVCRASASWLESGFSVHEGFIAVAAPWSQEFNLVESLTIEVDCLFCRYRSSPCECPPMLRRTRGAGWSGLADAKASVWDGIEVAFAAMSGPATMRCERSNVVSRVVQRSDVSSVVPTVHAIWVTRDIRKAFRASAMRFAVVEEKEARSGTGQGTQAGQGAKFSCEFCGKGFDFQCRLTRHVEGVHGEHQHACHACGKRFSQKANLAAHMKHLHRPERAMLKCEVCGRHYRWKANLNKHLRVCHRQLSEDNNSSSQGS